MQLFNSHNRQSFAKSDAGFTLVELMVTMVIVGILGSLAIPLYEGHVKRARAQEADAALSAIRAELRVYWGRNLTYPIAASYVAVTTIAIDIDSTDLAGNHYGIADYTYQSTAGTAFTVRAVGSGGGFALLNRQITDTGVLTTY